jgi:hypothetical protein
MSAKKGRVNGLGEQLPLPLGGQEKSNRRSAGTSSPQSKLIQLHDRIDAKKATKEAAQTKQIIQKLIEHADTLTW